MKANRKVWAFAALGLVAAIAAFLWGRHIDASYEAAQAKDPTPPPAPQVTNDVVVAIGSFDFAEPNNRYPEFPESLAQFLDARKDTNVTFVSRKRAGKVAPTSPDAWILNGAYSALPAGKWQAVLNLERVRGGEISLSVDGEKGDDLNEKIAAAVIKAVTTPNPKLETQLRAGKREEAVLHEERGMALGQSADPGFNAIGGPGGVTFGNPGSVMFQSRDEAERRKFRIQQAIRSFESAVALATNGNRAKSFLASCYLSSYINEAEKGRALLNEVIESGPADKIQDAARIQLARSFEFKEPTKALEMYRQLSSKFTNGMEAFIVKARIENLSHYVGAPVQDDFEVNKKKAIANLDDLMARLQKTNRTMVYMNMTHPFESLTDPAERTAKSLAFIEELKPKYSSVTPYVLFDFMRRLGETEPQAQEAFRRLIAELKADPTKVAKPEYLFDRNWDYLTLALFEPNEELAMEALLLKEAVAAKNLCEALSDKMLVAKGVFLMNHRKLTEAIEAFEKVGVRMVQMDEKGPWGCGSCPCGKCPVSALAFAERCQKLLGLPSKKPGFHAEVEKAIFLSEHERPLLARDGDSLWLGDSQRLIHYRANGQKIAELKFSAPKYVSAIACGPEKIYIGTMGGGLLEVDKTTSETKVRRFEDGLLSDHICELKLISNQLWIGYGHRTEINPFAEEPEGRPLFGHASTGGAGYLDISSGFVTNYVRPKEVPRDNPSVWMNQNNYGDWAPSLPTLAIEQGPDASVYMAIHLRGLQRFEPASAKWSAVRFEGFSPISSIQVSPEFVCVGQRAGELISKPSEGQALWIRPRGAAKFTFFSAKNGLPHDDVGALLLDGKTLWAGGFGYVAELQLGEMKVTRVLSVPSREITHLAKAGDNLWVSTEDRVFHVNLGN